MPNPVFFESWEGYSNASDTTTGVRSRWAASSGAADMSFLDPHRTFRYLGSVNFPHNAFFDSQIANGFFCLHVYLRTDFITDTAARNSIHLMSADNNLPLVGLSISNTRIRVTSGLFTNVIGLTPVGIVNNLALHAIVLYGRIHPTEGWLRVMNNGFEVLALNNVNTQAGANTPAIAGVTVNQAYATGTISHIGPIAVFDEAVPMLPSRFISLRPSADSTPLNFTPDVAGANFSRVNNVLYNGPGFVSSSTQGHVDTYELTDLASPAAVVYGIGLRANMHKPNAGARIMELGIEDNGVDAYAVPVVLPGTRISETRCLKQSPDTNAEFTFAQLNQLKLKVRVAV